MFAVDLFPADINVYIIISNQFYTHSAHIQSVGEAKTGETGGKPPGTTQTELGVFHIK